MHKTARFNTEEYRRYSEAYYYGVIMAIRVADLAVRRFQLGEKTRRAIARAKRRA